MSKIEDKKAMKYQAIIKASEQLMREEGLHALNMNRVAKEAKVAKGTLYLYFKSREEIISTLALKAIRAVLVLFQETIQSEKTPVEQLKGIIKSYHHFFKNNHFYYELVAFYEVGERPTETPEMRAVHNQIIGTLVAVIEQGQADGTIKASIQPDGLALSMWGMTFGMLKLLEAKAQLIKMEQAIDEHQILQTYLQLFEDGIRV